VAPPPRNKKIIAAKGHKVAIKGHKDIPVAAAFIITSGVLHFVAYFEI
jgi:hypothetical protein